jgi:CBS domain-containing protein
MNKEIKNLITKDFEQGHTEDKIATLIPRFHASRDVIILMDDSGYRGVITQKQLTRSQMDTTSTKAQALMRNAPKLTPKTSVSEATRLMVGSNLYHLPVFENGVLLGVIKASDILEQSVDILDDYEAKEIMTKDMKTINITDSLKKALIMFREQGISRLPVKQENKVVGMISLNNIIRSALKPNERPGLGHTYNTQSALDVTVDNIMSKEIVTAKENATPRQIFELMKEHNISSVLIGEEGIVTRKDLLETLSYELNKEEKEVFIQLSSKLDLDKELILDEVKDFVIKNKNLGPGYIYVHVNKHKETHKSRSLLHIRLRVRCKDSFDITSEGYGEEQAIKEALRKLKTLLLKSDAKVRHEDIMEYLDLEAY